LSDENCIFENTIFDIQLAEKICFILFKNNIQSVIVEGGKKTLETFINANLWDEARVFKSQILLKEGVKSPELNRNVKESKIQNDLLKLFYNHD
jgi:diaminohydroxyphosphoribosylaminopyrimidine deaminase/5-amino-6-(5-phosphoribosylamino)uracil reductase